MARTKITRKTKVFCSYALWSDGELLEENGKLEFNVGNKEVLDGIEKNLIGKIVGDVIKFTLDSDEAYGDYNPDNRRQVTFNYLGGEAPEFGEIFLIEIDGDSYHGFIDEINQEEQTAWLNWNPPLAGRQLTYEIVIDQVEKPE